MVTCKRTPWNIQMIQKASSYLDPNPNPNPKRCAAVPLCDDFLVSSANPSPDPHDQAKLSGTTFWPIFFGWNGHMQTALLQTLSDLEWLWKAQPSVAPRAPSFSPSSSRCSPVPGRVG